MELIAEKAALRQQARERRATAFKTQHRALKEQVADDLIVWLSKHKNIEHIAAYWPINDEFDCRPLLLTLERCGYQYSLPVVRGPGLPLEFYPWVQGQLLKNGPMGTKQPEAVGSFLVPDVILLPLLAFDATGHRLGYGGGYYDRTLAYYRAQKPVIAIGLAFAVQEVKALPASEHDVQMDGVFTEVGFKSFTANGG